MADYSNYPALNSHLSTLKWFDWTLLNLLRVFTIAIGLYGIAFIFTDAVGSENFHAKVDAEPFVWACHMIGGGLALMVSTFTISNYFRTRWLKTHKLLGKIYVVGVLIACVSGFKLAFNTDSGVISGFGLGLGLLCWFYATVMAYVCVRQGSINQHKIWMYRSFAITLTAVFLRLLIPLFMEITNNNWYETYATVTWMGWVPGLIITEWFVVDNFKVNIKQSTSQPIPKKEADANQPSFQSP